jgi:hypothetical protein
MMDPFITMPSTLLYSTLIHYKKYTSVTALGVLAHCKKENYIFLIYKEIQRDRVQSHL